MNPFSQAHTPVTSTLRERAYQQALDDTADFIERQWQALPAHIRDLPATNWADFQDLSEADQRVVFEHHVKRGVLLALERAARIAQATVPDFDLPVSQVD